MTTLKQLNEYLTDEQKQHFSDTTIHPKAKEATDHFFGKDSDVVHTQLHDEKNEVHKRLEAHLGREVPHEEYKSGYTTDKHGRQVRLSKSIKDPKLQADYGNDLRAHKAGKSFSISTHRGLEVAGQTNPEPTKLHPEGHSWSGKGGSCKDTKDGGNRRFLRGEIRNGTVTSFLHNEDGKEVARASFQPYHNDAGHTMYKNDSYYGVDHKKFKEHVAETEKKLSGEHKGGSISYKLNQHVYNNNQGSSTIHPATTPEHIKNHLDSKDVSREDVSSLVKHPNKEVALAALHHPKADEDTLYSATEHPDKEVALAALHHPKADADTIDHAANHPDKEVVLAALKHPEANRDTTRIASRHPDKEVALAALHHHEANGDTTRIAAEHPDKEIALAALKHHKANEDTIGKAAEHPDKEVALAALKHPKANGDTTRIAAEHPDKEVRDAANKTKLKTETFQYKGYKMKLTESQVQSREELFYELIEFIVNETYEFDDNYEMTEEDQSVTEGVMQYFIESYKEPTLQESINMVATGKDINEDLYLEIIEAIILDESIGSFIAGAVHGTGTFIAKHKAANALKNVQKASKQSMQAGSARKTINKSTNTGFIHNLKKSFINAKADAAKEKQSTSTKTSHFKHAVAKGQEIKQNDLANKIDTHITNAKNKIKAAGTNVANRVASAAGRLAGS